MPGTILQILVDVLWVCAFLALLIQSSWQAWSGVEEIRRWSGAGFRSRYVA